MSMTNNAYSDLIHLFIDGEATETERNTLFGALKDSPELQEEFTSAMELKKAFAADIMQLQPPSYLQSQIAERAGFIVAASASVATAPAVVNSLSTSISSALSTAAPIATTAVSKGLIALAIGTSVGILSTIGVIKLTSNDSSKVIAPAVSQNMVRPMQTAPSLEVLIKPEIQSVPEATFANAKANTSAPNNFILRSAAPLASMNIAKASLNQKSKIISEASKDIESNSVINKPTLLQTEAVTVNNTTSNAPIVNEKGTVNESLKPIGFVDPLIPSPKAIGNNGSNRGLPHIEDMHDIGTTGIGRFSARLSGIATSKLFQGANTSLPIWNNYGAAVKYDLDVSNAVGLEYGHETFPIYLSNGKGGYDNYQSITWCGASFNYSAIYVELLGVHPEFRILAAESNAGLIAKISGGLVLPLNARFSISSNLEETMLFIQSNGTNITGNKLALTGSLTYHF